MKKPLPVLFLLLLAVLPFFPLRAQTPAFSQFYALPVLNNPAYVSAVRGIDLNAGYRRQWGRLQEGFQTAFASAALRACRTPLAFGLYAGEVREPFFGYRQQEGGLQIGVPQALSKNLSLHFGAQAGVGQHWVDFDRLLFSGQLDPLFGVQGSSSPYFQNDGSRVQTFEIAGGVAARGQISWRSADLPASIGFSVRHLAGSRDVSFLRLDNTQEQYYVLHGSVTTPITSGIMRQNVLYLNWLGRLEWEGALFRGTGGAIAQYEAAHLGLLFQWNRNPLTARNTHALTVVAGLNFPLGDDARCTLQYAFDGTVSGLDQSATGGAHELILTFTLPKTCAFGSNEEKRRKRVDCYHFAGKGYQPFLN